MAQTVSCMMTGWGTALPQRTVSFDGHTRYRVSGDEDQLSLATEAALAAVKRAGLEVQDLDLLVAACAVGSQPIPCTAALIHERIALGTEVPAMDVNTTCTSFVSALDVVSYMVAAGRYRRVLVVSAEAGSPGLNPGQQESYELFSDGAAAVVVEAAQFPGQGVVGALQRTWSEGAHSTEIRGGLTRLHAHAMTEENREDFLFDMQGPQVLRLAMKRLPGLAVEFAQQTGLDMRSDFSLVIPHQASRALPLMMRRLGVEQGKYVDWVADYGNMIAASIPFVLCRLLEEGQVRVSQPGERGDRVLLYGTAAGLTANMLAFQL